MAGFKLFLFLFSYFMFIMANDNTLIKSHVNVSWFRSINDWLVETKHALLQSQQNTYVDIPRQEVVWSYSTLFWGKTRNWLAYDNALYKTDDL